MGPRLKLPPYVHAFIDRHGKARFYFRRAGFNRIALPGLPWSSEFMDAYERAKAGQARIEIGATRTSVGTVAALVVAYLNSAAFHSLAPESRRTRRNILERFRVEHGDKRVALLQREHIERMLSAKIGTPVAALNWLVTLRVLMQFAVQNGMRRDDPTCDVKRPIMLAANQFKDRFVPGLVGVALCLALLVNVITKRNMCHDTGGSFDAAQITKILPG